MEVDSDVAVIGAGVVGCATALALARRGASVTLLEAETEPGLAASGTNSGILHTGFDSSPGELETQLILRSAQLRDPVLEEAVREAQRNPPPKAPAPVVPGDRRQMSRVRRASGSFGERSGNALGRAIWDDPQSRGRPSSVVRSGSSIHKLDIWGQ